MRILARVLASMPGLYRKKCKVCQPDNHFNFNDVEVRSISNLLVDQGGLLPVLVRAMECQLFMHVTCSYGYEQGNSKYQATGVSSGQEAPKNCITMC